MPSRPLLHTAIAITLVSISLTSAGSAQDKNTVMVPGGLGFAEFKGYESWEFIALSQNEHAVAAILGNKIMIDAYKAGIPANGKPFPDGARMAKVHWNPTQSTTAPGPTTIPGSLHDVDFMVKDSKRFPEGGWGYAAFEYDSAKGTFTPATAKSSPPQNNDAKCGLGCHTLVKKQDYVFTTYAKR
jgi:hypothetical protein